VAKKKTDGTPPAPRRAAPRPATKKASLAAAPADLASVTRVEPIDSAPDMGGVSAASAYQPGYDDIAQAAYQRYLRRGGSDGSDFDDWIEAERDLARRSED